MTRPPEPNKKIGLFSHWCSLAGSFCPRLSLFLFFGVYTCSGGMVKTFKLTCHNTRNYWLHMSCPHLETGFQAETNDEMHPHLLVEVHFFLWVKVKFRCNGYIQWLCTWTVRGCCALQRSKWAGRESVMWVTDKWAGRESVMWVTDKWAGECEARSRSGATIDTYKRLQQSES